MNRKVLSLSFLFASLVGVTSCSNKINQPIMVFFSKTIINNTIGVGETFQLEADVLNASDNSVYFESSNESVLSVSSSGVIEGISEGNAMVYAISEEDESINASINIKVVKKDPLENIVVKFDKNSYESYVNENFTLKATVYNYIDDNSVSYESSNTSVATIKDGFVSSISEGETILKAISNENPSKFDTCKLTVKENENDDLVIFISNLEKTNLAINEEITINVEVKNYKKDNTVSFSSSNNSILTVSNSGVVKGIKGGNAIVSITSNENNNKKIDIEFTVIDSKNGYNLVWMDDFDGTSLNENYWNYQLGDGSQYGIPGWGNSEEEYYQKENVSVSDGNLVITAKKESVGGKSYTSGRIRTNGKVSKTYGRVEARMKLPSGSGLWPAFWMLPDTSTYGDWPNSGEIDIMEAKGRLLYETSGALHYAYSSGVHTYDTATNYMKDNEDITGYHIYAIEWDKSELRWYCDDNNFMTINKWSTTNSEVSTSAPFDKDFYILFNLACGGHFDGYRSPSDDVLPASLYVDYVKWYQ